jgi:hypothetical protein
MSRIVVLSTVYLNIPSANGICARNLVEALRKQGHEVLVVCYQKETLKDEENLEQIHTIPEPDLNSRHTLIQKLIRTAAVVIGSTKPIINEYLTTDYYNKLCKINDLRTIDAVIAMYFPFESVEAMCRFSKEKPGVKTFIYELDSVGDGVSKSQVYEIYNRAYGNWLNKVYSAVDYIILMRSHVNYWNEHYGARYSNKMILTDIPVLIEKSHTVKPKGECVKFIYSGLIEKRYRSPLYLLMVFEKMSEELNFEFSFYSKGDCEEDIANVGKRIKGICQYGYVTPGELDKAILASDFLVSIGNSISRSVPSKLITYLGYGKPIIHFSSQHDDVCIEYLKKYDYALVINQDEKVEISTSKIIEFVEKNKDRKIDTSETIGKYMENTPAFNASLIDKRV